MNQLAQLSVDDMDELPWFDHGFHGGDLYWAAKNFDRPVDQWIDLSTGVNPHAYPVPDLGCEDYKRLPYLAPDFLASIEHYYGQSGVPVAGSQQAIDLLPGLLRELPVLLPKVGYKGYEKVFSQAGFVCKYYPSLDKTRAAETITAEIVKNPKQHLVIINPNNPTGLQYTPDQLNHWARQLDSQAMLIVDEAFMDLTPSVSLLNDPLQPNVIILRSFGKFFGLAGLRLGVLFSSRLTLLDALDLTLDPWRINGPAQAIATKAYNDERWQKNTRKTLLEYREKHSDQLDRLVSLTQGRLLCDHGLFSSILMSSQAANTIWLRLARAGILTRQVPVNGAETLLRFGCFDSVVLKGLQDL
jgi:cobalamin biosynthetic protein CobC